MLFFLIFLLLCYSTHVILEACCSMLLSKLFCSLSIYVLRIYWYQQHMDWTWSLYILRLLQIYFVSRVMSASIVIGVPVSRLLVLLYPTETELTIWFPFNCLCHISGVMLSAMGYWVTRILNYDCSVLEFFFGTLFSCMILWPTLVKHLFCCDPILWFGWFGCPYSFDVSLVIEPNAINFKSILLAVWLVTVQC